MISFYKDIEEKLKSGSDYMIVAVGDSITWGLSHCNEEETYCAELARRFAEKIPYANVIRYDGIAPRENCPLEKYSEPVTVQKGDCGTLTLVKSGVGGDTVQRAIKRFGDFGGSFINGKLPDMFLLMFGINDSLISEREKYASPEEFFNNYQHLCGMLKKENPNAEIILMTPTYNDLGTDTSSSLDSYSDKVRQLARGENFKCIDLHKLWMEHMIIGEYNYGQRNWLSDIRGDYCHFSPTGSAETAKFILSELDK